MTKLPPPGVVHVAMVSLCSAVLQSDVEQFGKERFGGAFHIDAIEEGGPIAHEQD